MRHGQATPKYFQSGAIYALAYWPTTAGAYLNAVGVDNEYARPSIALLDPNGGAVTSPQFAGTGFLCEACPRGAPGFFALFPPGNLAPLLEEPYDAGVDAAPFGQEIKIGVDEGMSPAGVIYMLRDDFTLSGAAFTDNYWMVRRTLENARKTRACPAECPEFNARHEIETYTAAKGWQKLPFHYSAPPGAFK